ncbi:MAG: hypothetical protein FWB83_01360 [Treponema sp.]|nr:hypothetical protein [Treponema sp.]
MRDSIITTFIRQDLANRPLFINALAQIIIKILYQESLDSIGILEKIFGIVKHKIDKKRIEDVLKELANNGKILKSGNNYSLSDVYRKIIDDFTNSRNVRFNRAVEKYFNNSDLDKKLLAVLFDDINIAFFSKYNNEWIEDFIGRSKVKRTYIDVFKKSIQKTIFDKYKIKSDIADWFYSQYISFLLNNDYENGILMLDYANSLFAAKLVSANIFADTSVKELLKNTKVILDTNILLCLNLEKDKYSDAYKALEEIFILLEIEPIYFRITKDEYIRVINAKIEQINNIIKEYDNDILSKSDDVFLQTLLFRNCYDDESLSNFYTSLREIPDVVYKELSIKEYDNNELCEYIEKEIFTKKLQSEMNEIFIRFHKRSKRENSLNHDAGLISGLKYIKNTSQAWILTRDGTVHSYSIKHAKIGELPIAINLSTLINILCINEGGIDINSENFSPIFAQFVKNDVIPLTDTFQIEDLTRMSEIEAGISQLPNDVIINLAKEINNERFKGETDNKIALNIQRSIQSYKIRIKDELEIIKNELSNTKERENILLNQNENIENNYKTSKRKELLEKYLEKFRRTYVWKKSIQIIILLVILFSLLNFVLFKEENIIISLIISIFANILTGSISYKIFWLPNYFKEKKKLEIKIEEIVNETWNKIKNN